MRLALLCLTLITFAFPVLAQDEETEKPLNAITFLEYLREHNRLKPMQNPKYEHGTDVLDRRVMDQTKKAIGQVEDVIVSSTGDIRYLKVNFDRISLRKTAYLDYTQMNIGANNDGYALSLREEDIKDLFPKFIRKITPHGEQISLTEIIGKEIRDSNKIRLGVIEEILFDEFGSKVEHLYIKINHGLIRDAGLAIPFKAVDFDYRNGYVYLTIDKAFSDIAFDYVKK